jgi:hypothetical protein
MAFKSSRDFFHLGYRIRASVLTQSPNAILYTHALLNCKFSMADSQVRLNCTLHASASYWTWVWRTLYLNDHHMGVGITRWKLNLTCSKSFDTVFLIVCRAKYDNAFSSNGKKEASARLIITYSVHYLRQPSSAFALLLFFTPLQT